MTVPLSYKCGCTQNMFINKGLILIKSGIVQSDDSEQLDNGKIIWEEKEKQIIPKLTNCVDLILIRLIWYISYNSGQHFFV